MKLLKFLIMDEADRILNMDFEAEVDKILRAIPRERKTYLFSATMTAKGKKRAKTVSLKAIWERHLKNLAKLSFFFGTYQRKKRDGHIDDVKNVFRWPQLEVDKDRTTDHKPLCFTYLTTKL